MEKHEEWIAEAQKKANAVKTLLESDAPDMVQVNKLQAEADGLVEQAKAYKKANGVIDFAAAPQQKPPLPTDGDELPPAQPKDTAVKALYTMRFGKTDDAVKAILSDLHGADYEQKRYEQWTGFTYYLRTGDAKKGHNGFLWTPDSVKKAIMEGVEVSYMKTVMVEGLDDLGGYVVPEDLRMSIISRMAGLTVVRPIANVVTTSRDMLDFPTATGGDDQYRDAVRVTWVDETPTAGTAATNLTFGQEKIPIYTVMAETFLSRNLVEDAAFNILGWLAESFASAQGIDEDNRFLKHAGDGSPQGILKSDTERSSTTIAEVVSEDASALTGDGVIALVYGIGSQYRQSASCRIVGARATMREIRQLKTGSGEYLWDRNFQAGQPDRILGYGIGEQENMPTITASYYPLIFGDFSGYTIADRVGMSVERYLDSATARINQICFVARRRLGGQCTQPWKFAVQKISAS
jgi:HK97 family phage major capsid protein